MEEESIEYQLLILGDSSVGKTCTLLAYLGKEFSEDPLSTIGVDSKKKKVKIILENGEEKEIFVKFIDTAGQERFRSLTSNYYKHADGIILMFDTTNINTYNNINNWVNDIKEKSKKDIIVFIVGNKIDLNERVKNKEEFENELKKYNYEYYEISAKNNINVKTTIEKICTIMYNNNKKESNKNQKRVTLTKYNSKKNCC